jgi:hypothetical protein
MTSVFFPILCFLGELWVDKFCENYREDYTCGMWMLTLKKSVMESSLFLAKLILQLSSDYYDLLYIFFFFCQLIIHLNKCHLRVIQMRSAYIFLMNFDLPNKTLIILNTKKMMNIYSCA